MLCPGLVEETNFVFHEKIDLLPNRSSPKLPQPIFFPTLKLGPTINTPEFEEPVRVLWPDRPLGRAILSSGLSLSFFLPSISSLRYSTLNSFFKNKQTQIGCCRNGNITSEVPLMDAAILFFDGDEDSTKAGSSHSQIVSTGDLGTVKFILWGNSSFRCPGSNLEVKPHKKNN